MLTGSNYLQQEELAEQLDVGKAAVSRVVSSLEAKGYVKRMRQASDKRAYSIALTDRSVSLGSELKSIYNLFYERVREDIADEDIIKVESLLSRVAENLKALEDENAH